MTNKQSLAVGRPVCHFETGRLCVFEGYAAQPAPVLPA
jgi:hypothetical protein